VLIIIPLKLLLSVDMLHEGHESIHMTMIFFLCSFYVIFVGGISHQVRDLSSGKYKEMGDTNKGELVHACCFIIIKVLYIDLILLEMIWF